MMMIRSQSVVFFIKLYRSREVREAMMCGFIFSDLKSSSCFDRVSPPVDLYGDGHDFLVRGLVIQNLEHVSGHIGSGD